MIGILLYYYFFLLSVCSLDWNTAVSLFPSCFSRQGEGWIGRLPYLYFLLLGDGRNPWCQDWKTAVFILPLTTIWWNRPPQGLEDCRIYTSFYSINGEDADAEIGRLPYLYFLLLGLATSRSISDWKTAVFILPLTLLAQTLTGTRLEDCRIYTSSY